MAPRTARQSSDNQDFIADISELRARTEIIEKNLAGILRQLESVAITIGQIKTPNYLVQIGAVTVILAIMSMVGTLVYNLAFPPIQNSLAAIQHFDEKFYDDYSRHMETLEADKVGQRQHGDLVVLVNERLDRLQKEIDTITTEIVPRGENKEHWDAQSTAIAEIRHQVDDLKTTYSNIFDAKDIILHLQQRLDAIDGRLSGYSGVTPAH